MSPYPKHHIKQLTLLRLSYLKSQGVKMVFATDLVTNVFHEFAEYLYGKNMQVRRWGSEQIFYQRGLKSGAARLGAGEVLSGESQLRRPPGFFIISGHNPNNTYTYFLTYIHTYLSNLSRYMKIE